jgi:hypothetical protein
MSEQEYSGLSKSVNKVLYRLYPSMAADKKDSVLKTWIIALGDIEPEWIEKAIPVALRGRHEDIMYHSFFSIYREICLELRNESKVSQEIKESGDSEDYGEYHRDTEVSKKEAIKIQDNIAKNSRPHKEIRVATGALMECVLPDGTLKEAIAYGHLNLKIFEAQCIKQFRQVPTKVFHSHNKGIKKKITFRAKDYFSKSYVTSVRCKEFDGGTQRAPITVGTF